MRIYNRMTSGSNNKVIQARNSINLNQTQGGGKGVESDGLIGLQTVCMNQIDERVIHTYIWVTKLCGQIGRTEAWMGLRLRRWPIRFYWLRLPPVNGREEKKHTPQDWPIHETENEQGGGKKGRADEPKIECVYKFTCRV